MEERDERFYLQELAEELTGREWVADVRQHSSGPVLEVTNPRVREMSESIVCQNTGESGPTYSYDGGQVIGSVTDVERAADQIQHVLRSVGR
jgi:hypothetical protein